jgi:hypothetical protein
MKTKLFLTAAALLLTAPAIAEFTLVTEGAETVLADVRLPRNDHGTIAYKPCEGCDFVTRRVAPDARWEINGKAVTLPQFRKRTEQLADRDDHTVTVTRHIESNRITLVSTVIRESE